LLRYPGSAVYPPQGCSTGGGRDPHGGHFRGAR